jgi:hypothetical protein
MLKEPEHELWQITCECCQVNSRKFKLPDSDSSSIVIVVRRACNINYHYQGLELEANSAMCDSIVDARVFKLDLSSSFVELRLYNGKQNSISHSKGFIYNYKIRSSQNKAPCAHSQP